jgi:hypothetical protein
MEERWPYKPEVTGSSPVPPTLRRRRSGHPAERRCATAMMDHGDSGFIISSLCGAVVQLVRTPACHVGGREFESRQPRQVSKKPLEEPPAAFFMP